MNSPVKPPKPGQTAAADPTAILPIPTDNLLYGLRADPAGAQWEPAVEEAPDSFLIYGRKGTHEWVEIVAGGLSVNEIVPAIVTAGTAPTTLNVYGTGFTAATVIHFNGAPVVPAAVFVTADHMTVQVDPTLAVPAIITVTAVGGTGAAGLHIVPASTSTPTVTEIVPDMATVGFSAALVANVYGTGFIDGVSQVLWDGVPLATSFISANQLGITIDTTMGVAPSSVTVTVAGATGAAGFVFISGGQYNFVIGLTHDDATDDVNLQPAGNSPATLGGVYVIDRVRNQWEGLELGLDGRLRAPLATDALAGTITEPPPDDKGYVRRRTVAGESAWVPPADAAGYHFVLGLTHDDVTGDVNLTPAGWAPEFLGGVYTNGGRSATEGLDLNIAGNGLISAPLATPALAGTIVEPPADDKGYVRRTDLAGASAWVPPADTPSIFAGLGLSMDETTTPFTMNLQPAGYGDPKFLGGIYEPPMDGMAYSRQYEVATNTWIWTPALTAGLQITGLIPNTAVFGPTEPTPLEVHAYGSEFTATTVAVFDGADVATTVLSATELTFLLNPRVPISETVHIVTVRDTALAPPDDVGLGAEQFKFVIPSIAVDYGTGLSFDTSTTPPIVNLQPAQNAANAIGGVYVVDRTRTEVQGLELNADGELKAPLATSNLAGSIIEPFPDGKGYVRMADPVTMMGMWVPPADTPGYDYGTGLAVDRTPVPPELPIVNLQPAGDAANRLGGVWVPPRDHQQGLELDTVNMTGELKVPLATPFLAGAMIEPPQDDKGYVRRTDINTGIGAWVPPAEGADTHYVLGLSHDDVTGDVNLTPAGWAPELLGGVWTAGGRTATEGLDLSITGNGQLSVPLATDLLAGSIVEPPPDGQKYVRERLSTGVSHWVHAAAHMDYRVGLHEWFDAAGERLNVVDLKPATTIEIGGIYEAPNDGERYIRQFEQWEKLADASYQFRIGLTESGGVVDLNVATENGLGGLTEPPADRGFYVRTNDGVRAVWVPAGSSQQPQRPAGSTVSTRGVVYIPPDQGIRGETDGRISLLPATGLMIGGMKEALVDGKQYARKNAGWEEVTGGAIDYGVGLTLDDTTTPNPTVNLDVANFNGEIGGITVVARSPLNGLEYDITTGTLWAPPATNTLLGGILEPVADGKGYVRASQPDGSYQWVPPAPSGGGCTISDTPPLNPVHEDLWWESDSGTMFIYYDDGTSAQWVQTDASPEMPSYGIGIDLEGGAVNLKPANFNGEIGGVMIVGRSPLNGLEYDAATGTLWAPPGTDVLAGSIVEPPKDGKPYARTHDDINGARWTETSNGAVIIADDPPAVPPTPGALWFDSNAGTLAIWYQDADSSQWVQVNGSQASGDYLPLTGGTMVGPIVLPSADPTLPEHATHKKYVDVAIANQALYQSTWLVATNVPDLTVAVANPLHGYSWTAVTANPAVPEVAPAGLPGIGGTSIASGDTIKYNATLLVYEHIKTASSAGGIGDAPSDTTTYGRVDATWVNVLPLTGGVVTGAIDLHSSAANGRMSLLPGDATNNGRIDWYNPDGSRKAYIGYAGTTTLQINLDGATRLDVKGGSVFVDATANCGYLFGDTWHGMYFHGGNTLAFTEYHDRFEWRHQNSGTVPGGTVRMSLYGGNLVVSGNVNIGVGLGVAGNSTLTGTVTMAARSVHNGGVKVPESTNIEFADGSHTINGGPNAGGLIHRTTGNHWFFVDGTHVFEIDDSGGSWPTVMRGADQLARDLNVAKSERGSVSILNTMIAMAAKIKELEAKIAACCDGK